MLRAYEVFLTHFASSFNIWSRLGGINIWIFFQLSTSLLSERAHEQGLLDLPFFYP